MEIKRRHRQETVARVRQRKRFERLIRRVRVPSMVRLSISAVFVIMLAACCPAWHGIVVNFEGQVALYTTPASTVITLHGFGRGAQISVNGFVQGAPAYFILFRYSDWTTWNINGNNDTDFRRAVCYLPTMMRYEMQGSFNFTHLVQFTDQYTLQVLGCSGADPSKFTGEVSVLNTRDALNTRHLSVEQQPVPTIYLGLTVVYVIILILYGIGLARYGSDGMMYKPAWIACLLIQSLSTLFQFSSYYYTGLHGHTSATIGVFTTVLSALSVSIMLMLGQALSHGWSIIRRLLASKEWTFIVSCALANVQVFVLILHGLCGGNNPSCNGSLLGSYLIRALVMVSSLLAMNFNISQLRIALYDQPWGPSTAALYYHLDLLINLRKIFIANLIMPLALVVLQAVILSWRTVWVYIFLRDTFTFVLYTCLSLILRPRVMDRFTYIGEAVSRAGDEQLAMTNDDDTHMNMSQRSLRHRQRSTRVSDTQEHK